MTRARALLLALYEVLWLAFVAGYALGRAIALPAVVAIVVVLLLRGWR
jgi:hypothetical protein